MKKSKENVNIVNSYSVFQILLFGVPQGSIVGPILAINDIFLRIKKIWTSEEKFQRDSKKALDWFKSNEMIVNSAKFQAIIVNGKNKLSDE